MSVSFISAIVLAILCGRLGNISYLFDETPPAVSVWMVFQIYASGICLTCIGIAGFILEAYLNSLRSSLFPALMWLPVLMLGFPFAIVRVMLASFPLFWLTSLLPLVFVCTVYMAYQWIDSAAHYPGGSLFDGQLNHQQVRAYDFSQRICDSERSKLRLPLHQLEPVVIRGSVEGVCRDESCPIKHECYIKTISDLIPLQ